MADKIEGLINQKADELRSYMDQQYSDAIEMAKASFSPQGKRGAQTSLDTTYYNSISDYGVTSKKEAVSTVNKHYTQDAAHLGKQLEKGKITQTNYDAAIAQLEKDKAANLAKIDSLVESSIGAQPSRSQEYAKFEERVMKIKTDYEQKAAQKIMTLADAKKAEDELKSVLDVKKLAKENPTITNAINKVKQSKKSINQKPVKVDLLSQSDIEMIAQAALPRWADGGIDFEAASKMDMNKAVENALAKTNMKASKQQIPDIASQIKGMITRKEQARSDNSYITKMFAGLGTNVSTLVKSDLTAENYQKEIVKQAAAHGLTATFKGSTLQLHPAGLSKDQAAQKNAITEIQFMDVDPKGNTLSKNDGMQYANQGHVIQDWKNKKPRTALVTSHELQYKNFLDKNFRLDAEGKPKETAFTKAAKKGDTRKAASIGKLGITEAIGNAPGNLSQAVANETMSDRMGIKTNEQAFVQKGYFDISELAKSMAISNQEYFKALWKQMGKGEFDPYSVGPGDEINEALNQIYALKAIGADATEIPKMLDDALAKRIYNDANNAKRNEEGKMVGKSVVPEYEKYGKTIPAQEFQTGFHHILSSMEDAIRGGLVPKMESNKEESVLRGRFTVSGASQLNPLGMFMDTSNRAPHQVANYIKRADQATTGKTSMFSSAVGVANGVDYNSKERGQYTGFMADDPQITAAMNELSTVFSEQEKMILSTFEGGILMPESLAKELTGYRSEQNEERLNNITSDNIASMGFNAEDLMNMELGGTMKLNKKMEADGKFGETGYKTGDIIKSITRTEKGFNIAVDRLEKVKNGTKILTEAGGRQTARVMSDDKWNALMAKMTEQSKNGIDYTNAKWITEEKHNTTKAMGFDFTGRISNIINQSGKSADEVLAALQDTAIGKGFYKGEDGKLRSTIALDRTTGKYTYANQETGKRQELFNYDEQGNASEAEIAKVFVENLENFTNSLKEDAAALRKLGKEEEAIQKEELANSLEGQQSDISKLGISLLGEEQYKKTIGLNDQFINQANEVPYMNPTGSGSADLVEKQGRVKFGYRERDANERAMNNALVGASEEITECVELLRQAETEVTNRYGTKGKEAQEHQKNINQMIEENGPGKGKDYQYGIQGYNPDTSNLDFNELNKTMVISFGPGGEVLFDGQKIGNINVDNLSMRDEDPLNKDKQGSTQKEYEESFMGKVRSFMEAAGKTGLAIQGTQLQGDKMMKLYDMGVVPLENGNYMESQTDKIINDIMRDILNAMAPDASDVKLEQGTGAFKTGTKAYSDLANHKDSTLYKSATESFVPNSKFFKMIGYNNAMEKESNRDSNTIQMTSEGIKSLYRTQQGAGPADIRKNIKQLLFQNENARKPGDTPSINKYTLNRDGTYTDTPIYGAEAVNDRLHAFDLENQNINSLLQIQETLLDEMIQLSREKSAKGESFLTTQDHRFPSTSGLDIRYADLMVNDYIGNDDVALVPRGHGLTYNADYDGDKGYAKVLGVQYSENFEEYQKIAKAVERIKNQHTEVAKSMVDWENKDSGEDESTKTDRSKKTLSYISDLKNRKRNVMAGTMSKFNKKYVGQFSNASTNARNFMKDFGMDEFGKAGTKEAAMSGILRSFYEVGEQDSISAKKIGQRMEGGKAYSFDELQKLLNMIQNGEDDQALNTMKEMGIDYTGRQYEFEKASIKAAVGEEQWKKWFPDVLDSNGKVDEEATATKVLKDSFAYLRDVMNSQLLGARDVTFKTQDRKAAIENYQQKKLNAAAKEKLAAKTPVNPSTGTKAVVTSATTTEMQATANTVDQLAAATDEAAKAEKALAAEEEAAAQVEKAIKGKEGDGSNVKPQYTALMTKDGADYATTHSRDFYEYGGKTELSRGRSTSATKMQDLLGYINTKGDYVSDKDRHMLETTAAKGTYAHRMTEIMNKTNTTSLSAAKQSGQTIDGMSISEAIQEAENELFKTLGYKMTNDVLQKLQLDSEVGMQAIQGTELAAGNSEQEVTFGGRFNNGNRYVSGQADMIGWKGDGSGITIGDWKFSGQNDDATSAKRIMQASMYLAMYKQDLLEQLNAIQTGKMEGSEEELTAKANEIQGKLNAINNGNNTMEIYRVKDGVVETFKTNLLNDEMMLNYMDAASEYSELDAELDKLESKTNKTGDDKQKIATIKARMEQILNSGVLLKTEEILNLAGLTRNAEGQLANAAGLSPYMNGQYNKETGTFEDVTSGKVEYTKGGSRKPSNNKMITDYMKYYKRGYKLEEDITKTEGMIQNSSGSTRRSEEARLKVLQEQLAANKQMMGIYDKEKGTLNGIKLTEAEITKLINLQTVADDQHALKINAINTKLKTEAGLLDKMLNGFKQQFSNFLGMNLTYQIVGKLRQMFTEILSTVKELDANMVDIQIACGQSREEVEGMMKGFNELAMKTGRSTNDVASAANECDLLIYNSI